MKNEGTETGRLWQKMFFSKTRSQEKRQAAKAHVSARADKLGYRYRLERVEANLGRKASSPSISATAVLHHG